MTSTVLDVTVLLLCVSASVVVLGGVGDDVGAREPAADEAADRLVTETVTVRYRTAEAANGTRTVHATRAELVALLAVDARGSNAGHDGSRGGTDENSFESRAREAIAAGIGGRTRIDVIAPPSGSREGDARGGEERRSVAGSGSAVTIGDEPPRNVDVATAVVAHPAPSVAETDDPVRIVVRRW